MIDKTKQYTTRSGLPARIYATDGEGEYPVHGAVLKDGCWFPCSWTSEGKHVTAQASSFDLIKVKQRIQMTAWVNVYDDFCNSHASREIADDHAAISRRACVKVEIDCEEGEGL